jgi:hypothetical protein
MEELLIPPEGIRRSDRRGGVEGRALRPSHSHAGEGVFGPAKDAGLPRWPPLQNVPLAAWLVKWNARSLMRIARLLSGVVFDTLMVPSAAVAPPSGGTRR